MFIVRDLDWKFVASNFKGYFNRKFDDRDRQNCSKNRIFRKIKIRKIGNILTINNSGNFRDHQMASKSLIVSKIRRSNYPNWTVLGFAKQQQKHVP